MSGIEMKLIEAGLRILDTIQETAIEIRKEVENILTGEPTDFMNELMKSEIADLRAISKVLNSRIAKMEAKMKGGE